MYCECLIDHQLVVWWILVNHETDGKCLNIAYFYHLNLSILLNKKSECGIKHIEVKPKYNFVCNNFENFFDCNREFKWNITWRYTVTLQVVFLSCNNWPPDLKHAWLFHLVDKLSHKVQYNIAHKVQHTILYKVENTTLFTPVHNSEQGVFLCMKITKHLA